MITINTNLSSLIVQSNLNKSTLGLNQAIERMTTGFKINHAKDNAANYSISTNITSQLSSYETAMDNAAQGLDLITTASDSLDLITSHLQRIRDLSEQAANGTYGEDSLKAIQAEVDARTAEINRIMSNTEYNGIKLFRVSTPGPEMLNADGFLQDVQRRDTSSMISVSTLADNGKISGGTYKISTREDLEKLIRISKNHHAIAGGEFVLANDIDASGLDAIEHVSNIIFDGNGYSITNQTDGLFSNIEDSEIKNLALKDVDIQTMNSPLGSEVINSTISNCYATGQIKNTANYCFGGLVGLLIEDSSTIDSCWTDVDIEALSLMNGGIAGWISDSTISNSFSLGNVINTEDGTALNFSYACGIAGLALESTIENCYTSSQVSSARGEDYEFVISSNYITLQDPNFSLTISNVTYDPSANPDTRLYGGVIDLITASGVEPKKDSDLTLTFQVGIHSGSNSQINLDLAFNLPALTVNVLSSTFAQSSLDKIDKILTTVSNKQTEYGAAQNRLESAIESIGVSIENLTSTRSTLRDADVGEESSAYIKNQILQQASATLLATANQAPSIALQLI